jgi:hypothetical protein
MQKIHRFDAERPFVAGLSSHHYACRETRNANEPTFRNAFQKRMREGGLAMFTKLARRRLSRPAAKVLARPRDLFGESLPELLLLVAVVAAVVSAVLGLDGVA